MAEIPSQLLDHMLQTKDALGRIEANQTNTLSYLQAVERKVNGHINDKDAHGLGIAKDIEKRTDRRWVIWTNTIMAGGAFMDLIWRMFHKSGRGP